LEELVAMAGRNVTGVSGIDGALAEKRKALKMIAHADSATKEIFKVTKTNLVMNDHSTAIREKNNAQIVKREKEIQALRKENETAHALSATFLEVSGAGIATLTYRKQMAIKDEEKDERHKAEAIEKERAAGIQRAKAKAEKAKRDAKDEMRAELRRRFEADLATLDDASPDGSSHE
jgi:hypothetical protein